LSKKRDYNLLPDPSPRRRKLVMENPELYRQVFPTQLHDFLAM
jgi:hypothetical protein